MTLAALLVSLWFSAAPKPQPDPWFGEDKLLHFGVSAGLAAGGWGGGALFTDDRRVRAAAGASLALGAGVAKELWDLRGEGDASWRDLAWDAIGTASGLLLAWSIDALLRDRPAPSDAGNEGLVPPPAPPAIARLRLKLPAGSDLCLLAPTAP